MKIQGGHTLSGQVTISGAKNSALALMAATLLCSDECRLRNVPSLVDIRLMNDILSALGVKVDMAEDVVTFEIGRASCRERVYGLV